MSLAEVLAAHRARPGATGAAVTHTSMGSFPFAGAFSIPDGSDGAEAFRRAYVEAVDQKARVAMVERHTTTGPVIIDLDFRMDVPQRAYTSAGIDKFVEALVATAKFYVEETVIDVVVLEKVAPRQVRVH
jgi:alcohol dehydrogenase class IV